ncbi:hypothetical protein PoB_002189400 [Plakobranchus ocellatus]|uniref:Uncharacterized protein n=1 Tax=Plakobranchus ocellatus TaxID=259542 RepID=A0AAV3ZLY4_9GAST|nr:hypothetical protein PoB_002189400 [Plakobranchus ocellatus]
MATSVKKSPIVVMAPRELHLRKFYGDGGASDTRRFLEEIQAAWESQRCETDREKRCLLWSHLGVEVRQELNCLLDGDTSDPHKMLALLSSSYGERRSISALMGNLYTKTAPGRILHGLLASSKGGV